MGDKKIEVADVVRRLRDGNNRYYAIALHTSGLGDQLITACASAKLGEIFGLRFAGIVEDTLRLPNRIDDRFEKDGSGGWFQAVFGDEMPVVDRSECLMVPVTNDMAAVCEKTLSLLESAETNDKIVVFRLGIHEAVMLTWSLEDIRGNYLDNDFLSLYRVFKRFYKDGEWRNARKKSEKHSVVLHLRIGDTLPLRGFKKDHYVMLHMYGNGKVKLAQISDAEFANYIKRPMIDECLEMLERIVAHFGDAVQPAILTDGVERPISELLRPENRQSLEAEFDLGGFDFDSYIQDIVAQSEAMMARLAALAPCTTGEGRQAFKDSIRLLQGADTTIVNNGNFAISVQNFLSDVDRRQVMFRYGKPAIGNVRRNFEYKLFDGDAKADFDMIRASIESRL